VELRCGSRPQLARRGVLCVPPTGCPSRSTDSPFGAGLLRPVLRETCARTVLHSSTGGCNLTVVSHHVGVLPDLLARFARSLRSGGSTLNYTDSLVRARPVSGQTGRWLGALLRRSAGVVRAVGVHRVAETPEDRAVRTTRRVTGRRRTVRPREFARRDVQTGSRVRRRTPVVSRGGAARIRRASLARRDAPTGS